MWKRNAKSTRNSYGVAKIKRDSYHTYGGVSRKGGWWVIRGEVWARDKGQCVPCRRRGIITPGTDVHHIIRLADGGCTVKSNLITVCERCHEKRHSGNHHLVNYHKNKK